MKNAHPTPKGKAGGAGQSAEIVAPDGAAVEIVDHRIGDEARAVSARALHVALGIRRDFTSWFKAQVKRAGFVEGEDFVLLTNQGEQTGRGGHNRADYLLTLNAAQHVALMTGTPAGRAYRAYLIRCERTLNGAGLCAFEHLVRLTLERDRLEASASDAGRILGSLRARRRINDAAVAPLLAIVAPMLPGFEAEEVQP